MMKPFLLSSYSVCPCLRHRSLPARPLRVTALGPASTQPAQAQRFEPSKESLGFAAKQVRKMSLDEKVGQLIHVGLNARFANQESGFFRRSAATWLRTDRRHHLFRCTNIRNDPHREPRRQTASIPMLMSLDAETGIGMRFEDRPTSRGRWQCCHGRPRARTPCRSRNRPRGSCYRHPACLRSGARREQ